MRRTFLAVLVLSAMLPGAAPADESVCTGDGGSGGDWASYGQDLAGTRNQPLEDQIGAENAGLLQFSWVASGVAAGNSTAIVAGRCVYVAESGGVITALRLDTGQEVWSVDSAPSYASKNSTFAVAVLDDVVYANVSEGDGSEEPGTAPIGAAFDAETGTKIYESLPIEFGAPTTAVASAIAFNGMQLVVTNGKDGGPQARPGYAILDASDGSVLHDQTTIPVTDLDRGYAGGGQWATPVVDLESGYAFNGTANPYSKKKEHRYDNAIIKIDVDPSRPATFGTIVDAYKGNVDQFIPGLDRQPLCDEFGDQIGYHPCCDFSVTCVQLDIDFGASPTSWRNADGELMVGDLQKSGIFHAVYADTMQSAWTTMVSTIPPGTAGNSSSAANDGDRIYVLANPGVLHALDPENGRFMWSTVVGDLADYHPVSVANGVVYVLGNHGLLMGFDARNGAPLLVRSLINDTGEFCFSLAGGVTIAHHTVLVNCDGTLAAYRLPEA